jgi:hypothetical protein
MTIEFNAITETFHYPDGTTESLKDYQIRLKKYTHLQNLQNALGKLKALYQNPGCMNETCYYKAKNSIEETFGPETPKSVFQEYKDA